MVSPAVPERTAAPRREPVRYIRTIQVGRHKWIHQVRIPLDSQGNRRLVVGSFPSIAEAEAARDAALRQAGLSIRKRGREVHEKMLAAIPAGLAEAGPGSA